MNPLNRNNQFSMNPMYGYNNQNLMNINMGQSHPNLMGPLGMMNNPPSFNIRVNSLGNMNYQNNMNNMNVYTSNNNMMMPNPNPINIMMNNQSNNGMNINNQNFDMSQNLNIGLINNMNNLNLNNNNDNNHRETLYKQPPANYKVSEETKLILENVEIARGKLISNLNTVSPTLQCSICLDLVMTPVECKICSKLFCKYCIDNWLKNNKECPNKHIFEKKDELDDWILKALGKIYLKCPYKGCNSDYAYKYWKNHVKLCKFKTKGIIKLETDDDETNGGDGLEKPFEWESIQFFVKDINGKTHTFVLPLSTTVKELKEKLEIKTGFKVEDQRLTCNGKTMENNKLLEYYGLQPNQTIMQITRLKGGN